MGSRHINWICLRLRQQHNRSTQGEPCEFEFSLQTFHIRVVELPRFSVLDLRLVLEHPTGRRNSAFCRECIAMQVLDLLALHVRLRVSPQQGFCGTPTISVLPVQHWLCALLNLIVIRFHFNGTLYVLVRDFSGIEKMYY